MNPRVGEVQKLSPNGTEEMIKNFRNYIKENIINIKKIFPEVSGELNFKITSSIRFPNGDFEVVVESGETIKKNYIFFILSFKMSLNDTLKRSQVTYGVKNKAREIKKNIIFDDKTPFEIVEAIIKETPDLTCEFDKDGYTILGRACRDNNKELVKRLLKIPNIDINSGSMRDDGNGELIKKLLKTSNLYTISELKNVVSPLEIALINGNSSIVSYLIAAGAHTRYSNTIGFSTNHDTELYKRFTIKADGMAKIMAKQKNIDFEMEYTIIWNHTVGKSTAIYTPSGGEPREVEVFLTEEDVEYLKSSNKKMEILEKSCKKAVKTAIESDELEIVKQNIKSLSLENQAKMLSKAVRLNNTEEVNLIIQETKESIVNIQNESGQTPAHYAARLGYYDVLMILIESGVNLNIVDSMGYSILDYALINDKKEVAALLISKGLTKSQYEDKYRKAKEKGNDKKMLKYAKHIKILSDVKLEAAKLQDSNFDEKELPDLSENVEDAQVEDTTYQSDGEKSSNLGNTQAKQRAYELNLGEKKQDSNTGKNGESNILDALGTNEKDKTIAEDMIDKLVTDRINELPKYIQVCILNSEVIQSLIKSIKFAFLSGEDHIKHMVKELLIKPAVEKFEEYHKATYQDDQTTSSIEKIDDLRDYQNNEYINTHYPAGYIDKADLGNFLPKTIIRNVNDCGYSYNEL